MTKLNICSFEELAAIKAERDEAEQPDEPTVLRRLLEQSGFMLPDFDSDEY